MNNKLILRFHDPTLELGIALMVTKQTARWDVRQGETVLEVSAQDKNHIYTAPCDIRIINMLTQVGDKIEQGTPIADVVSPNFSTEPYDITALINKNIEEQIWNLAIATNAVIKGLLGSMGASGQIAARTVPIKVELPVNDGLDTLLTSIAEACTKEDIEDGDVVVTAEKPFAVAQRRLVPLEIIAKRDPKKQDEIGRRALISEIRTHISTPVEDEDLILMDWYVTDPDLGPMATVGAHNHNHLAYLVAEAIIEKTKKDVDVVISDTDTGIDVRKTIIGTITIGATPLGATKGLSLYECMRAACAAEFTRGSARRIPIVICKPAGRCRTRVGIGEYRGYDGKLRFDREGRIAFA
jgi:hypothetical protein